MKNICSIKIWIFEEIWLINMVISRKLKNFGHVKGHCRWERTAVVGERQMVSEKEHAWMLLKTPWVWSAWVRRKLARSWGIVRWGDESDVLQRTFYMMTTSIILKILMVKLCHDVVMAFVNFKFSLIEWIMFIDHGQTPMLV